MVSAESGRADALGDDSVAARWVAISGRWGHGIGVGECCRL